MKYICFHAHFYQPPRENPWLEEVEIEESAAPFHDWNERIAYECYLPNSSARILDGGGRIQWIISNYEKISFNFGPTLLSWMERHTPDTYSKIIEGDKASIAKRSGHGNAIAQAYNHSIMPLNSTRDKETQIIWGIRDFEKRFGRKPEGIWFPEAAVDRESLLLAAQHGIKFTILSPRQAKMVRQLNGNEKWSMLNGEVDTSRPYLFRPDEKNSIAIFFYDGGMSLAIAFEGALFDGVKMGQKLMSRFHRPASENEAQLVHVATDGETYGHHHKFGEMALASAINTIENSHDVRLTNYGEYLEKFPPVMEVDIVENSSWSCAHGIERWRSDCGCSTGGQPGFNQKWRAPLREALTRLKGRLDGIFEGEAQKFFKSPWDARNDYIDLIFNRSAPHLSAFMERHQRYPLSSSDITEALKHLEMQKMAMRMFTSCGWFFNDLSGLETVQILKYAAKAMDLAQEVSLSPMVEEFLDFLKKGRSNYPPAGSGADIFNKMVLPHRVSPMRVAAHAIITGSLWKEEQLARRVYGYNVTTIEQVKETYLETVILVGIIEMRSLLTLETKKVSFCMLHLTSHDFNCFIHPFFESGDYLMTKNDILGAFRARSIPELIHAVERHFGQSYFTVKALFEDERRKVMEQILGDRVGHFSSLYNDLFEENRQLMDFCVDIDVPIPMEFCISARYVFERRLNDLFEDLTSVSDHVSMTRIFKDAQTWGITLKPKKLRENIKRYLEHHVARLCEQSDRGSSGIVAEVVKEAKVNNIEVDLWKIQNLLFPFFKAYIDPADSDHETATAIREFKQLFEMFDFSPLPEN